MHTARTTLSLLLLVPLAACERGEREQEATPGTATVEQIQEDTWRYLGETVTVVGEAGDVHSERAFELEGDDWIFDEEVLVVAKSPVRLAAQRVAEDDDVIVTGTVRRMNRDEINRELGWEIDQGLADDWADKPVIVASSVRSYEQTATWSEATDPEGTIVAVWTVYGVPNPALMLGRRIQLTNIPVRGKADKGVWVGFTHAAQIFAVPTGDADLSGIEVGDRVNVDGTLRAMPKADQAIADWGMDPQLSSQIAEEPLYIETKRLEETKQRAAAAPQPGAQQPQQGNQ